MTDQSNVVSLKRPKRQPAASEFVYFVHAPTSDLIKVGIASNMQQRLAALQCGSPEKLVLLGVLPDADAKQAERELHGILRPHRAHGEWFRAHPSLMRFIEKHAISPDDHHRRKMAAVGARLRAAAPVEHPDDSLPKGNSRQAKLARYKAKRGIS